MRAPRVASITALAFALIASARPSRAGEPKKDAPTDYDGRGAPPKPSALLWIPRVVFAPLYVLNEYVLRRPLGFVMRKAEHAKLIGATSDEPSKVSVSPSFAIDVRQRSSVGLFVSLEHLAGPDELHTQLAFGGVDWLRLRFVERVALGKQTRVELHGDAFRRSDGLFYGVGGGARDDRAYYAMDRLAARFDLHLDRGVLRDFEPYVRVSTARFDDDPHDGPTLLDREREGLLTRPEGFDRGAAPFAAGLRFALDTRGDVAETNRDLRLELHAEHAADLHDPVASRWVRYGGSLAGAVDVTTHDRIVTLTVSADLADPIDRGPIPFTELPSIGGDGPLPGFLEDRVLDRSVAAASLDYRYPIWVSLDGFLHAGLGNGFSARFEDFSLDHCRFSFGGGMASRGRKDINFALFLGSGTERFSDGARLDEARFTVALTPGF